MPDPNPNSPGWKPGPKQPIPPSKPVADLRARFQLPPQPPGVGKIADLVTGKANASMEEITEIISSDHLVTQRVMSKAFPKAAARLGATVQMATARVGVNQVIVVLVGELLTQTVIETFETMVSMTLELEDASTMALAEHGFLTSSVKFTGKANGRVTLAFSPHLSLLVASTILGGDLDTEYSPETINDAIGELVNIVTGNLQSRLCDAGLQSEVGLPEVKFQATLPKEIVPGGSLDQFFFRCGLHTLIVTLSMDPSAPFRPSLAPPRAPLTRGKY